jgi:hypothetical protein
MYKIKSWKDMNSWLRIFVIFNPLSVMIMLVLGIREYLSGNLNGDYYYSLFTVLFLTFAVFGMFGLFVKNEK